MEKLTCEICGKEVEGYNENHVNFLMEQHKLSHRRSEDYEKTRQIALKSKLDISRMEVKDETKE